MAELAYLNGVFSPIAEARVSIEDRGYQFGDGVYDVAVVYAGRPFLLDQHLRRLRRSAAAIKLDYDFDAQPLEPVIEEGLRRSELKDALIYIQITRGVAPRSHVFPKDASPTVVMTFKPLPVIPDEVRQKGVSVMTTLDTRWANCFIKAVTLLPNVLAKNDALQQGYFDAVFVTPEGEVREGTLSNIFMAKGDRLAIPPRTKSVLHGITQSFILECAAAVDLAVEEKPFHVDDLRAADEVFLSGTTMEVLAVTSIDGKSVASGQVGPITRRLAGEYRKRSRQSAGQSLS